MNFTKMHGAGNDFVILETASREPDMARLSALAKKLCARRTSIGADGLMVVAPARGDGDYRMIFFNADGSEGEMCGNGARCICRYGYEHGLAGETQRVETISGLVVGQRIDKTRYRVRLNSPSLIDLNRRCTVEGQAVAAPYLELGVPGLPHAVVACPELESADPEALRQWGKALRWSDSFPAGANVNLYALAGPDTVRLRTYERGVEDFTLACGTGSASTAAVLYLLGLVSAGPVHIENDGGRIDVELTPTADGVTDLYITGPTCVVCTGELTEE